MKRKSLLFLAFVLFGCMIAAAQTGTEYYKKAKTAFEAGNYDQAEEMLKTYTDLTDKQDNDLMGKIKTCQSARKSADEAFENGQWKQAADFYYIVLLNNPQDTSIAKKITVCETLLRGGSAPIADKPPVDPEGSINGHNYVDLGLSVLWATCNVGASRPQDYGSYYSWGDPSQKSTYTPQNTNTHGARMSNISGNRTYDVAAQSWGGNWRTPTQDEMEELEANTTSKWTTMGGINGLLVTSKINGNSIFLPAGGFKIGHSKNPAGKQGGYWSSTPYDEDYAYAFYLIVNNGGLGDNWIGRETGFCVRPVINR